MSKLCVEEINEVLYPLEKNQSYVQTKVNDLHPNGTISIDWYLNHGDIWWNGIKVVHWHENDRFSYHIPLFKIYDVDDARLDKILTIYSSYTDEMGYSFRDKERVLQAIYAFTSIMIKNWS